MLYPSMVALPARPLATSSIAERRGRYRARASRSARALHVVVPPLDGDRGAASQRERAERRVRARARGLRWERISALRAALELRLRDADRLLWRALEELLQQYWLELSVEHYNLGFDAGCAQRWVDALGAEPEHSDTSPQLSASDKLRALSLALAELVDTVETLDARAGTDPDAEP